MSTPITNTVQIQCYGDITLQNQILSLLEETNLVVKENTYKRKEYTTKRGLTGTYRYITITIED